MFILIDVKLNLIEKDENLKILSANKIKFELLTKLKVNKSNTTDEKTKSLTKPIIKHKMNKRK